MQSVVSCHMGSWSWGPLQKFSKYCIYGGTFETSEKINPSEKSGYFQVGAWQETLGKFYIDSADYKERRILTEMMLQHTVTICSEPVKILQDEGISSGKQGGSPLLGGLVPPDSTQRQRNCPERDRHRGMAERKKMWRPVPQDFWWLRLPQATLLSKIMLTMY